MLGEIVPADLPLVTGVDALGIPVVVTLTLVNPVESPIAFSVIAEAFCRGLLLVKTTDLETSGVAVLVLSRAAWTAAVISGCREEIILLISSCWLKVELGSAFYDDPEASRSEEGTQLSDEPDCVDRI